MLPPAHRKVSDSIANPIFFEDPSRIISEALKPTLAQIGAHQLHRVGLMSGIGFMVPANDGPFNDGPFNHVQIVSFYKNKWDGRCLVILLKTCQPEDHLCALESERVRSFDVILDDLPGAILEACS